jgi:hypothetical protein
MTIQKVNKYFFIIAALAALSLANGCVTTLWNEEVDRPHQYRFDDDFLAGPPGTPFVAEVYQEGSISWYSVYSSFSSEEHYLEDPGDGQPISLVRRRSTGSKCVGMALLHPVPVEELTGISSFGEPCDNDTSVHSRKGSEWKKEYGCLPPPCYLSDLYIAYNEKNNEPVAVHFRGADGLGPPRPFQNRLAGPGDYLVSASKVRLPAERRAGPSHVPHLASGIPLHTRAGQDVRLVRHKQSPYPFSQRRKGRLSSPKVATLDLFLINGRRKGQKL